MNSIFKSTLLIVNALLIMGCQNNNSPECQGSCSENPPCPDTTVSGENCSPDMEIEDLFISDAPDSSEVPENDLQTNTDDLTAPPDLGIDTPPGDPVPDTFDAAPPEDGNTEEMTDLLETDEVSDTGLAQDNTEETQDTTTPDIPSPGMVTRSLADHYDTIGITEAEWHIHDPTQIVEIDGLLMIGVTGKENADGYRCGLETWYNYPGESGWQPGQCLLMNKPDWVREEIPENDGAYWAPGFLNSTTMYYSVSNYEDTACIGLITASGTAPDLLWTDLGRTITCTFDAESNPFNAPNSIDPAPFVDTDGSVYLVYGGGHIWMTELDVETGLQINDDWWEPGIEDYFHLANGPNPSVATTDNRWIEAPFIYKKDDYYYLFVNWYGCCDGVDSTYEIHVGRSLSPTGPYVDREGDVMTDGEGSLVLGRQGRFIGPGHPAVWTFEDAAGDLVEVLSYHYYDGNNFGLPWIEMRTISWEDSWPVIADASFDMGLYWDATE